MKKEMVMTVAFIAALVPLVLFSIIVAAEKAQQECNYDAEYDEDKDYVMNSDADCGDDYQYDCDDDDKDVFKDCDDTLWKRMLSWLKGENRIKQKIDTANMITSNTIKKLLPGDLSVFQRTGEEKPEECAVTVCLNAALKQVYCPLDYEECCRKYSGCQRLFCEDELCRYDPEEDYRAADDYYYETGSGCSEEYHDCEDDGTEVVCKGRFEDCDASFENCICGTSDSTEYDIATPDIDTSEDVACDTGVYVCERQVLTMSGDVADSIVTCKESFQRCSATYGNCRCGNSSLTDFPTERIGSDRITGAAAATVLYDCEYNGKEIPCYMMPSSDCNEKKNTCDKGNGVMITCDGSFSYCNTKYSGNCLCGVETLTYS